MAISLPIPSLHPQMEVCGCWRDGGFWQCSCARALGLGGSQVGLDRSVEERVGRYSWKYVESLQSAILENREIRIQG